MDFKITHFLLFVVAAFLLYHLMGGCGCCNGVVDGFSVGGQVHTLPTCTGTKGTCGRQGILSNNQQIINTKVDTITNRLDALICQLVKSEKCITDQGVSDCK